ncbi:hypothetical protein TNCV_2142021 [Trichonephila clavipes]|uniref:Uncharacterized protein n=1 Tax=Trichonephila clavipes TaxID=2585209 RepID=A0A8X6RXN3_TRICX|nr:hypothetical protein TNCV_2142021 [Trichonephila clavipes]
MDCGLMLGLSEVVKVPFLESGYEHHVSETVVTRIGTAVAWGHCIIDTDDTAVAISLTKTVLKYYRNRFATLYEMKHMITNSAHTTHGKSRVAKLASYFERCDEAHFWLNGYVNKQNCRIWSEANPQVYVETPLHPEKLTVWCALWAGGILLQER